MNIAICDNKAERAEGLKSLLEKRLSQKNMTGQISLFQSGIQLIDEVSGHGNMEVCLINSKQSGLTGIEIINEIRHYRENLICVLYSDEEKDALVAWENDVFGYYYEPFTDEKAEHLVKKVETFEKQRDGGYLRLKLKDGWYHICFRNILYIESKAHKVTITLEDASCIEAYGKLDNFEKELTKAERFIRIHKSVLINGNYISSISNGEARMTDGQIFSVSRALQQSAKLQYEQYVDTSKCVTIDG